jgi:hypothetical protein
MPRKAAVLTALRVKTAGPGRYGDGDGLYLLVRSAEARFWVFRRVRGRKMREMGLGRAGAEKGVVRLTDARVAAAAAEMQQQAIKAKTFRAVAGEYIDAHEAGWRHAKHRAQWTATLETHHPAPVLAYAYRRLITWHITIRCVSVWVCVRIWVTIGEARGTEANSPKEERPTAEATSEAATESAPETLVETALKPTAVETATAMATVTGG